MNLKFIICLSFLFVGYAVQGQEAVQFSGITMTEDSVKAVPFVNIFVKSKPRATTSNERGYFNFVVVEGDTVHFTAFGYKESYTIIPENIKKHAYSILMVLERDTFYAGNFEVYPWPTKEDFKSAFMNVKLPEEYETARKNLEEKLIRQLAMQMSMDAADNYRNYMNAQFQKMYYAGGQQPFAYMGNPNGGGIPIPSSFLSPTAWREFFKAFKRGDFKKKK